MSSANITSLRSKLIKLVIFLVAFAGLGYELLLGALGSYLFGDYLLIYSLTIGTFLFALGLGSLLSKNSKDERTWFVLSEVALVILGSMLTPFLYSAYGTLGDLALPLFLLYSLLMGSLVGLELPLLLRILKRHEELAETLAKGLFWDYVGGLIISVAFPTIMIPIMGFIGTGITLALINLISLLIFFNLFKLTKPTSPINLILIIITSLALVITSRGYGKLLDKQFEQEIYDGVILTIKQSPYQRIAVVYIPGVGTTLWIDGNLQLAQIDEYRYHESLVHPAIWLYPKLPKRVLVLGGGDGMALRELERYPFIESIILVDIDKEMVELAKRNITLRKLNQDSFSDPRVKVVISDAVDYLERASEGGEKFDIVIVDFPDPHNLTLAKLYTVETFSLIREVMDENSIGAIQSTSPLDTRYAFWCINQTLEEAGFYVIPYRAIVPTFGVWGFNLFSKTKIDLQKILERSKEKTELLRGELKYLTPSLFLANVIFPIDEGKVEVKVNTELNPVIYRYYGKFRTP